MLKIMLRHISLLILTLFILSFFSFSLAYLFPGDPLVNLTGIRGSSEQTYALLAQQYAMNDSLFSQYWHYINHLFTGNWGLSFSSGLPLAEEISRSLAASVELSAYALVISFVIGLPLGFLSGLRHHKFIDYSLLSASVIGYSIPVFWAALIAILVFSVQLGWFPLSGRISLLYDIPYDTGFILIDILLSDVPDKEFAFQDALRHLVLPSMSIAIVTSTIVLRITRRSVVEVMNSEYIQAAYARGLSPRQVFVRHGIKNALIPILPLLVMQFTTLLTNAMIVETIFSWPGIGNGLIQAIYQRDFPAIRAGMLAVSALVLTFTITSDMVIQIFDPARRRPEDATS
ncbi:ABC transporter permease subunit [Paraglaciecola sp. L1A13]|uniref:ABC transporter permease n=1 Tax=Paraglaciecola sp. L1A13 TaxID=2686359 RepID=UPI00131CFDDF|nr:ABC transporter permease [Paraglaciecola sp. L1A13]